MSSWHLGIVVAVLLSAIALAMTNPTTEEYLEFLELRLVMALDAMDRGAPDREKAMLRAVLRSQGKRLIEQTVRPHTTRANWGLWSVYRTNFMGTEVIVIGVASWFVPVSGVEEATVKIGRLAF
jgi:Domain of unknown function (DUF4359)